jgi:hypothetical protein
MPNPFAFICKVLSEVSIVGFSFLDHNETDNIKLSGDFILKSFGDKFKSAVSVLTFLFSILSMICFNDF